MSKFIRDSFLALLGEVVMFAGALLYGLITARTLGPSGKGILGLLIVAYTFIVTIVSLRFERAVSFYAASKPETISETITSALAVGAGMVVCFIPLYWFLPGAAKYYLFGGVPAEFATAALLFLPATYLSLIIAAIQAGRRKFKSRLVFLGMSYGARVIVAFVGLVLMRISLVQFIIVVGIVEIVTDAALLVLLFRQNGWKLRYDSGHTRLMVHYSLSGILGVIAEMAMMSAPLFILGVLGGSFEAGLFVVSIMLTNTLAYFANAVKVVVLPYVATPSTTLDEAKVLRMLLAIELLMALGVVAVGRYLLAILYGPQFDGSYAPALVLVPGAIAFTYYGVLTASIQGRGRPGVASVPSAIGGILAIVISLVAIRMWGIMGAAAAGSLANLVGAAASIFIYSKLTGVPAANMYRIRREELRDFVFSLKARFGRQTST